MLTTVITLTMMIIKKCLYGPPATVAVTHAFRSPSRPHLAEKYPAFSIDASDPITPLL